MYVNYLSGIGTRADTDYVKTVLQSIDQDMSLPKTSWEIRFVMCRYTAVWGLYVTSDTIEPCFIFAIKRIVLSQLAQSDNRVAKCFP